MNEQELVEELAKRICTLNLNITDWDELNDMQRASWLNEANNLVSLIKEEEAQLYKQFPIKKRGPQPQTEPYEPSNIQPDGGWR